MTYQDIQGWFNFDNIYRDAVTRASYGAHFVEVGAWLGRSTAYMGEQIAQSGKRILFDAVDTWEGGTDTAANEVLHAELAKQTEPLYDQFLRNMKACGVEEYVRPIRSDSVRAAEAYPDGSLDFVFIDGDHSAPRIKADLYAYWPKVKTGGVFAGHDIKEPEVEQEVRAFCQANGVSYYWEGTSWVVEKVKTEPARILLGMPHSGKLFADIAMAAMIHPASQSQVTVMTHQTSLLAAGFNYLWAKGLEGDYTHFAMLHADIKPEWNWLDIMVAELERTGADLVSAVSPIKDLRGLTSTAIGHPDIWWSPLRRLTMREIVTLPATFTAADCGYPNNALLINTGCWLADLKNPKWRETNAEGELKVYFNIRDRLIKHETAGYISHTQPEDWYFSNRMYEQGLKAVATRKVQLGHYADFPWPGWYPWGTWEHDKATAAHWQT